MSILGFKIWFSDHTEQGKTYDDWLKCQSTNIQAVVVYEDTLAHQAHHYTYRQIGQFEEFYALDKDMNFSHGIDLSSVKGSVKTGAKYHDMKAAEDAMADLGYGFVIPELPRATKEKG